VVAQRLPDPRGGRVSQTLVDGPRRAQLSAASPEVTGLDAAVAETFPGPRLLGRRAEIGRDGQRRRVVLRRLPASPAPEAQFTQGVQYRSLAAPDADRPDHLQGLPEAVRRGLVVPGLHMQLA
jgi:hypothetical protein